MRNQSSKSASRRELVEEAAREADASAKRISCTVGVDSSERTAQETCELIAELSETILEQPDKAFTAVPLEYGGGRSEKNTGKSPMQQMLQLASTRETPQDEYTAQLAIVSLLAVLKDILPGYRIRLPTAHEMAAKTTKETKKLWEYERALLHHYQLYLKLLERMWENQKTGKGLSNKATSTSSPTSLAVTAILSLCELLKSAFHFNFRSNLLAAVVRNMNNPATQVREACCAAVEHVFAEDIQGEVALEAARQVAKMIRDRNLKVHASVMKTFVSLPLRVHVDEAQAAKLAVEANAKRRKKDKEIAEIEAGIKEGDAGVDKIVLARCQSDTLQAVTLTYFRILKSTEKEKVTQGLLPAALEGLAKFSHLINIETVMDLLKVLKGLLDKVDELPLDAALNCALTAMQTLQGPGRELKIDQKEYVMPLYSQLPRICTESNSRNHTDLVLRCLEVAFVRRREPSTVRAASFLKQILTVAMHAPCRTAVPLLALARLFLQRYPSTQQLLENEDDVITSGPYNPHVQDTDHCNPFATSAWELATLKFHIHPAIASHASAAAGLKMLQLPREGHDKIREDLLRDEEELYIPFKLNKKKHPLEPKKEAQTSNKKRRQVRFVTPRRKECRLEGFKTKSGSNKWER